MVAICWWGICTPLPGFDRERPPGLTAPWPGPLPVIFTMYATMSRGGAGFSPSFARVFSRDDPSYLTKGRERRQHAGFVPLVGYGFGQC